MCYDGKHIKHDERTSIWFWMVIGGLLAAGVLAGFLV